MTNNKIVFMLDREYKQMFRLIISDALKSFVGVPLEWEDIYYSFLAKTPEFYAKYTGTDENTVPMKTYMGLKCKNFARNYSRKFMTDKYKIMNKAYAPSDDNDFTSSLQDSIKFKETTIDIGKLTPQEMIVLKNYFLEGKSLLQISKATSINIYFITKARDRIYALIQIKYGNKFDAN